MKKALISIAHYASIPMCLFLWLCCIFIFFNFHFFSISFIASLWCFLFFAITLLGLPVLIIFIGISYVKKSEKWRSNVLLCVALQIVFTLALLGLNDFSQPPKPNQMLYAEAVTVQKMSRLLAETSSGMYFINTWAQSGTISSEQKYIANWLDFPTRYNVSTDMYYYYYPKKTYDYPANLEELLAEYNITKLPAAIIISDTGNLQIFEDLTWYSILQSENKSDLLFKQFLSDTFAEKAS